MNRTISICLNVQILIRLMATMYEFRTLNNVLVHASHLYRIIQFELCPFN